MTVKRLISCNASDILGFNASELKQSIKASEGRVILSETIVIKEPLVGDITDAEVAKSAGADLILLNMFDVFNPRILGLYPNEETLQTAKIHSDAVNRLRNLVGRPVGANLEPLSKDTRLMSNQEQLTPGRSATVETFQAAASLGLDFILLTGNPGVGTDNAAIVKALKEAKQYFPGIIMVGKMHSAGVDEPIGDVKSITEFIEAGADVVLVPAVGTVPGFTEADLTSIVQLAHLHDTLVCSAIGTSQEGSSTSVIENMAIRNKICGVDIQHIGDSGFSGVAPVENIYTMSQAIRGKRHTLSMIARSVLR